MINEMKKYVLGFAFDNKRQHIVLIEKQKPEWQKDKFNGIGGKVENIDENIHAAMVREFYEETGVPTKQHQWFHYATMDFSNDIMGGGALVYVFRMRSDEVLQCSTCETELIEILELEQMYDKPLMHNLPLLIPLALQNEFGFIQLNQQSKSQTPIKPSFQ